MHPFSILAPVVAPTLSLTASAGDDKKGAADKSAPGSASPSMNRPASKDDCMNGGWSKYNFKDQTQCLSSLGTVSGAGSSDNSGKESTSDDKAAASKDSAAAGSTRPSTTDSKSAATSSAKDSKTTSSAPDAKGAASGPTSGTGSSDNSGKTVTSDPKSSGSAAGSASPGALDRPASREDCRNWSKYRDPGFTNQNECISYVNKQSSEQKR